MNLRRIRSKHSCFITTCFTVSCVFNSVIFQFTLFLVHMFFLFMCSPFLCSKQVLEKTSRTVITDDKLTSKVLGTKYACEYVTICHPGKQEKGNSTNVHQEASIYFVIKSTTSGMVFQRTTGNNVKHENARLQLRRTE